ncbi:hypothetical protein GCM10023157_15950 [Gluconacetobacter asukensis]
MSKWILHLSRLEPPILSYRKESDVTIAIFQSYGRRIRSAMSDSVRLVIVSSGTGASTSFGIAEETLADLWGERAGSASLGLR